MEPITDTKKIFWGCNIEIDSFGLSCCAERVAIFKAVSEGHKLITHLAVVTSTLSYSCGACRQVMLNFNPEMKVLLLNLQGDIMDVVRADELLPKAFTFRDTD